MKYGMTGALTAALVLEAGAAAGQAMPCADCRVERFAACGGFLEGATIAPDGTLWMLDLTGDRILSVGDDGVCTERGKTGGRPNGAKFTPDGRMLITSSNGLLTFDPASAEVSVVVDRFEGVPLELNDLAIAPDGGVYFTAPTGSTLASPTGRVFYLGPGASDPVVHLSGMAFPNGVTLGGNGQLVLIAEFGAKRVLAAPTVGAGGLGLVYVYAYTAGGIGPDGLLTGPDGTLYAANFQAREVLAWDASGHPLGAIRLPEEAGTFVTNMALRDDELFITEAQRGEVWRVRLDQ